MQLLGHLIPGNALGEASLPKRIHVSLMKHEGSISNMSLALLVSETTNPDLALRQELWPLEAARCEGRCPRKQIHTWTQKGTQLRTRTHSDPHTGATDQFNSSVSQMEEIPYVHKLQTWQHPRLCFCELASERGRTVSHTWHCHCECSKAARLIVWSILNKIFYIKSNAHFRNSCLSCQSTTASNVISDRDSGLSDATSKYVNLYRRRNYCEVPTCNGIQ